VKLHRAGHQADQIDLDDAAEAGFGQLPALEHDTLGENEHVEAVERRRNSLDGAGRADVDPGIMETLKVAAWLVRIIRRRGSRPPDMDLRPGPPERLGDRVTDAIGSADHQHRPAGKIEIIHRSPSFRRDGCTRCDLAVKRWQPTQLLSSRPSSVGARCGPRGGPVERRR
jgi:hypothetical protein